MKTENKLSFNPLVEVVLSFVCFVTLTYFLLDIDRNETLKNILMLIPVLTSGVWFISSILKLVKTKKKTG